MGGLFSLFIIDLVAGCNTYKTIVFLPLFYWFHLTENRKVFLFIISIIDR
ncbi:hypothetical protein [Aquimarina hainanensis]